MFKLFKTAAEPVTQEPAALETPVELDVADPLAALNETVDTETAQDSLPEGDLQIEEAELTADPVIELEKKLLSVLTEDTDLVEEEQEELEEQTEQITEDE